MESPALDARLRRLASGAGFSITQMEKLPGDVGRRAYFRLRLAGSRGAIGVVYPEEEREARQRWNRVHEALSSRVRVPEILADNGEDIQILEDFGPRPLSGGWETAAPEERRDILLRAAHTGALIAGTSDPGVNPPFSADLFFAEMVKSREAVFAPGALSAGEVAVHDAFARDLAREIADHPTVLLHRDFHLDNLFAHGDAVGVIDFQDARTGPDSYDMASLLWERWTLLGADPAAAAAAIETYTTVARPSGAFRQRLARTGLQRAWKAAGTFARIISTRGGNSVYVRFLPAQVARTLELLKPDGSEGEFARILARRSDRITQLGG